MDQASWRNYRFLIAFVVLLAAQAVHAQGNAYTCDARFYQLRQPSTTGGSNLYLLDRRNLSGGGAAQWNSLSSVALNALGYNKADGFFYAVNVTPLTTGSPYRLYRLGTTGPVEVASLDGGGISANAIPNASTVAAGTVDRDGKLYIKLLQSDSTIYTVQLPTTSGGTIGSQGKITLSTPIPMADMAFDPITNRLYGVFTANTPASDGASATGVVYDIDPSNGAVVTKGAGPALSGTSAIGSAFFDVSGTLYAYQNGGVFGTIDLTTGNFTRITLASTAQQSDGASCVFPDEVISVSKVADSVEAVSPTVYKVPYTITVQNTGSIPDRNVQITENLAQTFSVGSPTLSIVAGPTVTSGTATANAGFNGTSDLRLLSGINTLVAGASVTISFTVQVTYPNLASVPTAATSNIVRASSTSTGPNAGYTFPGGTPLPPLDLLANKTSSPTPVSMVGQVDLAINKTGPATAVAGTSISYLLKLSNTGPSSANGATFSDAVPNILTGVTATCQNASTGVSGCAATVGAGNAVTGSVSTFPNGGTVEIKITGTVPSAATGTLSNQATVSAPTGTSDTSAANNTSVTVTTTLTKTADLAIDKSAPAAISSGGSMSYTVRVWNNGPSTTNAVGVGDTIPGGFTVTGITCAVTGTATCGTQTFTGGSITVTTGSLTLDTNTANSTPDGNFLTYTITGTAAANGLLSNTASLTVPGGTTDPTTGNNTSAAVLTRIVDAVNDTAVSYAFGSGGTVSVLGNDTNGGAVATTANTVVTVSNNGGITGLSVTNGQLVVPTTTPTGTYTVTYKLCDSTVATACDTATVSITVAPSAPTLTVSKISTGGIGTFTFSGSNGFGSQNITTATAGTAKAGTTQTLSAASTATTIAETPLVGYVLASATCSGMGSGGTATLSGTTLTLSAAATIAGSNIACTFTNTKLPTLTISKISTGGIGTFTFSGDNGFGSQNITTDTAGTAKAGTTQTLSAASTATTITETAPTGFAMTNVSCTGGGTVTPNYTAGTFTLDATATAAGNALACTVTNTQSAASPVITLLKLGRNTIAGTFSDTSIGAKPGETVEYCIVYTNTGGLAPSFKLTDNVPAGLNAVLDAYGTANPVKGVRWADGVVIAAGATAAPTGDDLTSAGDSDKGSLTSTGGLGKGTMTLDLGTAGLAAGGKGTVCFQAKVP